ncbi:MAG: hypothetical protein LBV30_00355 [Propionibacteriaceae bacterium]|jgi:predicted unusual protein kinase regulating ubiquinone biosynthesis (AarF/ABC1/UbiB family)|nr:hypothetical protein [Propionibacteriaceae bacterium]
MNQSGWRRYWGSLSLTLRFLIELWWLRRTRRWRGRHQAAAASRLYRRQARQFVDYAQRMGGLIVKLGQFMSVRVDLLPKEYIDELSRLQDALPAVPTEQIIAVIEAELQAPIDSLFTDFEPTALAAASLGQVHRAKLRDGRAVAIKVLRPGIESLVKTDLRTLRAILRLLDRLLHLGRFTDVAQLEADFSATFSAELDFQQEGHNAETCQRNLLLNAHIDIPQIHWSHSRGRVLTMEFMDGVRIDDLAAIDAAGIDRSELAEALAGIFFQMVLTDGFYHADPHPGNVLVRHDGVIQLIDFGMVGRVSPQAISQYTELVSCLVRRDAAGIVAALSALGFLSPGADTATLTRLIKPHIDALIGDVTGFYTGASFIGAAMDGQLKLSLDQASLAQIQQFIFSQPITLPGQTTFLGKALITVLGLCLRLDPGMDVIAAATPFVGSGAGEQLRHWLERAWSDGRGLITGLIPTAQRLMSVAEKLDDGSLQVELNAQVEARLTGQLQRSTKRITRAIVIGSGLIALALGWRRR